MKRFFLLSLTLLLLCVPFAQAQLVPVTTKSDDARVHYLQGIHAVSYLDFGRARVHLDAALAVDPDFAMAHLYRAVLSGGEKRAEHMRQATTAAARASEGERQMIESYAANLRDDHDREQTLLTAVAERYPSDPMPMYWWANTESNQGNGAAAVAAARRSLTADPSFAPAYNLIGYAEMAQGNDAAAEQAFREQIRLAPDEANPYDSYGEFLMDQGKLDEAEAQFEMALTKDPEFTVSRNNLTRIAIMRALDAHVASFNGQDPDDAAATYTANAVMSPPDGSQFVGRDAIRDVIAAYFATGRITVEAETQEILPMDDNFAYTRTAITVRTNGEVSERGINSFLWVKTPDGWKVARDTWTSAPTSGTN